MKCPVCDNRMKLTDDLTKTVWDCQTCERSWNDEWVRGYWSGYKAAMREVQDRY